MLKGEGEDDGGGMRGGKAAAPKVIVRNIVNLIVHRSTDRRMYVSDTYVQAYISLLRVHHGATPLHEGVHYPLSNYFHIYINIPCLLSKY